VLDTASNIPSDRRPTPDPLAVEKWLEAMREEYGKVTAQLRKEIEADGDLNAAYRQWYKEQMLEHDKLLADVCERLAAASGKTQDAL
jgi:hypothetical protein